MRYVYDTRLLFFNSLAQRLLLKIQENSYFLSIENSIDKVYYDFSLENFNVNQFFDFELQRVEHFYDSAQLNQKSLILNNRLYNEIVVED